MVKCLIDCSNLILLIVFVWPLYSFRLHRAMHGRLCEGWFHSGRVKRVHERVSLLDWSFLHHASVWPVNRVLHARWNCRPLLSSAFSLDDRWHHVTKEDNNSQWRQRWNFVLILNWPLIKFVVWCITIVHHYSLDELVNFLQDLSRLDKFGNSLLNFCKYTAKCLILIGKGYNHEDVWLVKIGGSEHK